MKELKLECQKGICHPCPIATLFWISQMKKQPKYLSEGNYHTHIYVLTHAHSHAHIFAYLEYYLSFKKKIV